MWVRLGEVCAALADASGTEILALWCELSGGLLESACRTAVRDGALAQPTLERCVDHLASESLIARLTPFLEEIRRWKCDETEWLVRHARREIEGVILAILALRCAAGEQVGPVLLNRASHCADPLNPADEDLEPVDPSRPVSWIEACVPALFRANPWWIERCGSDRVRRFFWTDLDPALRRLRQHELDEYLPGVRAFHRSTLQRLIRICRLRDIHDLNPALVGAGEIRLVRYGDGPPSGEDLLTLPQLVASEDARVRLVSLVAMTEILDHCAESRRRDPPSAQLQIPRGLLTALDAARVDVHPVIAGLAVCASAYVAHPSVSPTSAVELLRDPHPVVRAAAARTVGRMTVGANWGDELAPLLCDSAATVRLAAVEAVRLLGKQVATPAVLTNLRSLLDDPDLDIRMEAIETAIVLGPALTEAYVERLVELTDEESEIVRSQSIKALVAARHCARDPDVFHALVYCFDDGDSYVCECALRAYTDLNGPADAAVLDRVRALFEEERDKSIRAAAKALLTKIGHSGGPSSGSLPS